MGKTKAAFIGETLEPAKKEKKEKVHLPGQKGGERVKIVDASPTEVMASETASNSKKKGPKVRGKRYLEAKSKIDRNKLYKINDAIKTIQENSVASFDGTMEMHLVVKKDGLSTSVDLPHSTGKSKKVEIADEQTVKKLQSGNIDFDVLLATPEMMPKLVPFARILGPKGLMPNPKNGTVIKDKKAAEKFNASKLSLKTEKKAPLIHTVVGKVSMKDKEIAENIEAVLTALSKRQIIKAYLKSTMSPSVKLLVE